MRKLYLHRQFADELTEQEVGVVEILEEIGGNRGNSV